MTPRIDETLRSDELCISFEFFPPRTPEAEAELLQTNLALFAKQRPIFLDMTWGAGGSTSEKTMALCEAMQAQHPNLPVNMHITCTNMPRGLIKEALDFAKEKGIRNIVALRGDPPRGEDFKANEDGFTCALDLVKYIRSTYGDLFCITVAGYPEGHPSKLNAEGAISGEDYQAELEYLKQKVDAGANLIITQLFYDAKLFITFVRRCREIGITVPILPGMLPVTAYASLKRMIELCKTYIPADMQASLDELKDKPADLKSYGVKQCVAMIKEIQEADIGVNHFHFYTINSTEQTFKVLQELHSYVN